jgi:hypothetical protein
LHAAALSATASDGTAEQTSVTEVGALPVTSSECMLLLLLLLLCLSFCSHCQVFMLVLLNNAAAAVQHTH